MQQWHSCSAILCPRQLSYLWCLLFLLRYRVHVLRLLNSGEACSHHLCQRILHISQRASSHNFPSHLCSCGGVPCHDVLQGRVRGLPPRHQLPHWGQHTLCVFEGDSGTATEKGELIVRDQRPLDGDLFLLLQGDVVPHPLLVVQLHDWVVTHHHLPLSP